VERPSARGRDPRAGEIVLDLGHARALRHDDDLVRALGWKRGVTVVVDATAGLGRDAAALAKVGFAVIAIERAPALAAAWWRALPRGPRNLAFLEGDARDKLRELAAWGLRPDAIYLDPMYPGGDRRAAPQKEMVLLRELVGEDPDAGALLDVALEAAGQRVVVKRPRKAPPLQPSSGKPVHHTWAGSSTRYDLYVI
jgi:16S rRNA (guanine1516-N2)-methyltransferase